MRGFLVKALEKANYDVVAFENGEEAYERLKREPFTLLLTDIVMPKMDGIELARRASEIDPEYVDVVRMAPLINGEGRWFGASRARKQQVQDRQQVDSATWALTFGQRSQDSDLTAV